MTETQPTAQDEARAEHIAQAWNSAYERAHPPERAYEEAEKAGKAAAAEWDRQHRAT